MSLEYLAASPPSINICWTNEQVNKYVVLSSEPQSCTSAARGCGSLSNTLSGAWRTQNSFDSKCWQNRLPPLFWLFQKWIDEVIRFEAMPQKYTMLCFWNWSTTVRLCFCFVSLSELERIDFLVSTCNCTPRKWAISLESSFLSFLSGGSELAREMYNLL